MSTINPHTSGRAWAYAGTILGGLVSVLANLAHSFVPPNGAPANWSPDPGAVVESVVWPIFLFVAIEILARVAWPRGLWYGVLRYGGLLPVALVAAFVSYEHLSALLTHYQEQGIVCVFGPLAVDGLMVMATGALLATNANMRNATPTLNKVESDAASTNASWQTSTHSDPEPATPTPAAPVVAAEPVTVPAHLISPARFASVNHESTTGRPITAEELSARLSIPPAIAGQLLTVIEPTPTPTRVNGHPVPLGGGQ